MYSTVSIYKTQDGTCIASAEPGTIPASMFPSVTPHGTGSQMPWMWTKLYIVPQSNVNATPWPTRPMLTYSKSFIVWAVANADTLTAALDTESEDKTRITAFELSDYNQYHFGETKVSKLGDVVVSGKAEGVTVHQDPIGMFVLTVSPTKEVFHMYIYFTRHNQVVSNRQLVKSNCPADKAIAFSDSKYSTGNGCAQFAVFYFPSTTSPQPDLSVRNIHPS